jgi:hypothetical protein
MILWRVRQTGPECEGLAQTFHARRIHSAVVCARLGWPYCASLHVQVGPVLQFPRGYMVLITLSLLMLRCMVWAFDQAYAFALEFALLSFTHFLITAALSAARRSCFFRGTS